MVVLFVVANAFQPTFTDISSFFIYAIAKITLVEGLVLPANFKLTRFYAKRRGNAEPNVSSTFVASTVAVSPLVPEESLLARLPGKTFVSDYRGSGGALQGAPVGYLLDSPSLPNIEQVKEGGLYRHTLLNTRTSVAKPYLRWIVLGLLLVPSLAVGMYWMLSRQHITH